MNKLTYGRLCELAEKHGVTITEKVRAFVREVEQTDAAQPATEPIAWESTTFGYRKYLTQAQYERIGERFRKWYKPYRCSACTKHEASAPGLSDVLVLSDDDTAKWAEQNGAQVAWSVAEDMHHIVKLTPPELRSLLASAATVVEPSEDAKRLEHIVAIGWEGLRKAWERFGEDHDCETALKEIRAVIDADRARPQAAQQQAEPGADERAAFELPDLPEPLEIDWPSLNAHALGCGVEDRGLYDRYDCANYGFEDGVDKAASCVPNEIYDADQMREYAQAAISAWQARAAQPGQLAGVADGFDLLPPLGIRNDRDMLNYLHQAFENEMSVCPHCYSSEPTSNTDSASFLRQYLAAAQQQGAQ